MDNKIRCALCGKALTIVEVLLSTPTCLDGWALCDKCIAKMNREAENKANYKQDIPKYTKT